MDVQADLQLHCPLFCKTGLIDIIEYSVVVRSDCLDVQADLQLHCPLFCKTISTSASVQSDLRYILSVGKDKRSHLIEYQLPDSVTLGCAI